jgi:hypothetical protein
MIDLTTALGCIKAQKENRTYGGAKIGRITQECGGMASNYSAGQIVLFTEELHHSDSQLRMGEYAGMKQQSTGRVTIETPLTPEEIGRQRAQHSLLTTMATMINVPIRYVEEIRV